MKENFENNLTSAEIVSLYIESVRVFAETASRADLSKDTVFELGQKLFNKAIESINPTKKKLSA